MYFWPLPKASGRRLTADKRCATFNGRIRRLGKEIEDKRTIQKRQQHTQKTPSGSLPVKQILSCFVDFIVHTHSNAHCEVGWWGKTMRNGPYHPNSTLIRSLIASIGPTDNGMGRRFWKLCPNLQLTMIAVRQGFIWLDGVFPCTREGDDLISTDREPTAFKMNTEVEA